MDLFFAYIDPGSGSLIIQALIAGLVALPIFFRHQISRACASYAAATEAERTPAPTG